MSLHALALVLALLARPAGAAFEDLGSGARAPGMGNAFTALADDVYAVHYNPAGLAQLERGQLSTSYSKLYLGLSDGSDLGTSELLYGQPIKGGKAGGIGGGWQRFGLSELYSEQVLSLGYGRSVYRSDSGSRLLVGLSAKYMSHSFKRPPEATNACNGLTCNAGDIDPVLAGNNSKSAIGADLGLLYRFPRRFQAGLLAQNLNRPDVGFSGPDKLPMNLRLGLAYKTLWMSLAGELKMDQGSTGSRDRDIVIAAERLFPSLDHGQLGLRGSVGFGSRQWKQLTMGLSYRINKILIDYAFLMPIGGFGSQGTHRISLGFHFGAPTPDDEITQSLLTQAKEQQESGPSYGYEYSAELRPHDLQDPQLAAVRQLIAEGQYRKAGQELKRFLQDKPEPSIVRLANRLDLVSYYYPELSQPNGRPEAMIRKAIDNFLQGHDRKAVLQASYAFSMGQDDAKVDHFLAKMEQAVGVKADRLPPGHPRSFMDEMLYRVEAANNRREYDKVQSLLKDILEMEPENTTALERVGSTYFVTGHYQDAVDTWQWALPLEKDASEIENLKMHIDLARSKIGPETPRLPGESRTTRHPSVSLPEAKPVEPVYVAPTPAAPVPAAPADAAPAPAAPAYTAPPAPAYVPPTPTAPAHVMKKAGDPRDVDRLYQSGVEHYARGEYLQAKAMFTRILQIDPENAQAKKAMDRIDRRKP